MYLCVCVCVLGVGGRLTVGIKIMQADIIQTTLQVHIDVNYKFFRASEKEKIKLYWPE